MRNITRKELDILVSNNDIKLDFDPIIFKASKNQNEILEKYLYFLINRQILFYIN
jgi:hypothetical protein